MILFWSSVAASLLAVLGCGYLVCAIIAIRRSMRSATSLRPMATPSVTILKPLHGAEPTLLENLQSFCRQDYAGPVQIIFGVQDSNDDAIAVVEHLRKAEGNRDLDLVVDPKLHGLNRKVCNLVNMAPRIRHDVVVIADSDMRVGADYLSRVVAALEKPGIGAVTCLYFGVAATGFWARLGALAINAHFLPSVVLGRATGWARPCFGSTIAMRRTTLDEIGGFTPFVDCLADDYAIGEALRAHGYEISIPPFAIAHVGTTTSAGELWRHELRWARTIRSLDPPGYAGLLIAQPLPWALIATILGAGSTVALPAIGIAIAAVTGRALLLRQVEQAYALPPQSYWLVPARDLLSFALFVVSFLGWDVTWKGQRYRMVRRGSWVADRG
jgi:ceramide glucosyltransferase